MIPEKYEALYEDILHVSHGPYARLTGIATGWSFKACLRASGHVFKLVKDYLLYGRRFVLGKSPVDHKIWLIVGSKNNLDSLAFLKDELENSTFMAIHKAAAALGAFPRMSFHGALYYLWRFFPLIRQLRSHFGSMLWWKVDEFVEAVGLYEASIQILEQGKPKALIFSNDHGPQMRALMWAARSKGIPTIYLQHASVSEYFPPLRFDLNLLEGQDSLEKYQKIGLVEGMVKLVGMPKFDKYLRQQNHSKFIQRIGICISLLDETPRILKLLNALQSSFPDVVFSFRPHPREVRTFDLPKEIQFSDAKQEGIFSFLQRQDLIIAGDTSTHLEAILLNVVSLYFPFNDQLSDYYGYVRNGLVESFTDTKAVCAYIGSIKNDRPAVHLRAKPYNAVVGTPQQGKSRELAARYIKEFLELGA